MDVNVSLIGGKRMKKKKPLVTYMCRQDDDQESQEIGLYPNNDSGLLAACLELIDQMGYNVFVDEDD
jgi:hypothetical protein